MIAVLNRCYGHNDQNVWIIQHYVIWTDFITPNMEVRGPGQEPFVKQIQRSYP